MSGDDKSTKLRRNLNTSEAREFWRGVDEAAKAVRSWPAWKRGEWQEYPGTVPMNAKTEPAERFQPAPKITPAGGEDTDIREALACAICLFDELISEIPEESDDPKGLTIAQEGLIRSRDTIRSMLRAEQQHVMLNNDWLGHDAFDRGLVSVNYAEFHSVVETFLHRSGDSGLAEELGHHLDRTLVKKARKQVTGDTVERNQSMIRVLCSDNDGMAVIEKVAGHKAVLARSLDWGTTWDVTPKDSFDRWSSAEHKQINIDEAAKLLQVESFHLSVLF